MIDLFLMPRLAPELPEMFRVARARGATTSLDTNDDPAGVGDIAAMYAETDILLPNAAEARHLAGVDSPIVAADEAMAHVSRNGKTS